MHEYQVGELYNPNVKSWLETPQYNYRSGSHELVLFFKRPSTTEITAVKDGKAEFALAVRGDIIFFLYRFGTSIDWSDAPYSWHLVPEAERAIMPGQVAVTGETRALLTVILVDADSGIIRAMRVVSLSPSFTSRLNQAIVEQSQKPFNSVSYDRQLTELYKSYPNSSNLLKIAIARSTT